jgi:hypothetical protein
MSWKKEKPVENPGLRSGCLSCGPQPITLPLNACMAVGFGGVTVRREKEIVWSGDDENRTVMRYENMARKDPDHDWRIEFFGPLSNTTYQRHEKNKWVLIEKGLGFA